MGQGQPEAVLITGVYGAGKSSVIEEMANVLEDRGIRYAAMDLDWLSWFDAGWDDDVAEHEMLLRNLGAVVGNYRSADIERYLLALSVEDAATLQSLKDVLDMRMSVIRLTLDLDTIKERLRSSVTTGRKVDLQWAEIWLAQGTGAGLEDFAVSNDRPIQDVTDEILRRLSWV